MKTNDANFSLLWGEALTAADQSAYVSDWRARSSLWGDDPEPADIPAERIEYLDRLWIIAHMSVRDMCKAAGLSQAAFAQRFCIPLRTVENWCCSGPSARACPDYIRLMMAQFLGLIER